MPRQLPAPVDASVRRQMVISTDRSSGPYGAVSAVCVSGL